MAKSYTPDPEAYQRLFERPLLAGTSEARWKSFKGIEHFQQAISKDPAFALAYAGLAGCYCARGESTV